jgi:predicted transcriptional regulator YdeE
MDTTERTTHVNEPVTILGRQVRTDPARSVEDIPALWAEVTAGSLLADLPGRLTGDVYAVYSDLEHAGRTNDGAFSFTIGVPVAPDAEAPPGLSLVTIPRSRRAVFPAPENDPSRIIEAWQLAWASDDAEKTFLCEYELYAQDGTVAVHLGVR